VGKGYRMVDEMEKGIPWFTKSVKCVLGRAGALIGSSTGAL
jgi:hypothetical protein